MTADEVLEDYLVDLRYRLGRPGAELPAAELSEVVDECRDHLLSNVELLAARGRTRASAARLAIIEFGAVSDVAAGLRAEFRRRVLLRLSALLLVTGPILGLAWQLVVTFGPPAPWPDQAQPPVLAAFDIGAELTAVAALALAAVSLAMIALPGRVPRLERFQAAGRRAASGSCLGAVLCALAALMQTLGYLVARGWVAGNSVAWPLVGGVAVLTVLGAAPFARPLRAALALRRSVAA